ncbi:hypothetical protein V7968_27125 [Nocardia vulneris]|uniref:hypothetical protein n=1 Tax=Nocardia vulneris TaxID=1141657 RepID=UPI0030D0869E
MQRSRLVLILAAVAALLTVSAPASSAQAPAGPDALGGGIPPEFTMISQGAPNGPACIYYNEAAAGRGAAENETTCRADQPHIFTRLTQSSGWVRFELLDFFAKCLIGDTSTSPGVLIVGSCDDPRADWGGGGTIDPPVWHLYPRSNPSMYLRDTGIAIVLQNTPEPWNTPGYSWRLL